MKPEEGCRPNVYYKNVPGQFIAGTLYGPDEEEVLIGAKVRLLSGGKRMETFVRRLLVQGLGSRQIRPLR